MYEAMQKLMDISSKPLKIIDDNGTVVGTMFIEKCDYKSGHFSETGYHSYYQQHIDVRARFYPEKSEKHKDNSRTVTGARAVVMVNGKEIGRFDNVTIGHKHNPCHEISRDAIDALHYMTGSRKWETQKPEDPVINGAWAKAVKENFDKLKSGEEFPGIRKIGEPIEFGSAYVKPNEINGFTEVCMIGGGGGSQKKKCPGHEFKEYVGFTQSYRYCIHCDTKENV